MLSTNVFIASEDDARYNKSYREIFNQFEPGIVFAGKNYSLGEGYTSFSSIENNVTTFNHQRVGNTLLKFPHFLIVGEVID